jgi:cell division protein ZapA
MKTAKEGVTVSILGKEFMVACPEEEREALNAAAKYLDRKMREIQDGGRVIGTERCALMAALNIANELLEGRRHGNGPADLDRRLKFLHSKIDVVLQQDIGAES